MNVTAVLAVFALMSALTSLGFGVAIANALRARDIKANPWLVRFMIFRYMAEYKRVTVSETGTVGSLYYGCSASGTAALVLGIATVVALLLT